MATKAIQQYDNLIIYDDTKYLVNKTGYDDTHNLIMQVKRISDSATVCEIFAHGVIHWDLPPGSTKRVRETTGGFTITLD